MDKFWPLIPILMLNSIHPGMADGNTQCLVWCNFGPAVQTPNECLCGTKMNGWEGEPFEAFMGIPFAKPPVGRLRFANPVPFKQWETFYNASIPKPICIQKFDFILNATVEGQEDCLYLNVYRPKVIHDQLLPVMVYIHGGGYIGLSVHPSLIGPEKFMDTRKVILVTIQYRLGAFGFLSTDDRSAPGNFGLKDQVLALRWVQVNIGSFGGDRKKVTIFGQSAGGSSVQLHMMSPLSKELFAKAISQSGSALSFWNEAYPNQLGLTKRLAVAAGIDGAEYMNSRQLVKALQKVDATRLVNSVDTLKVWYNQPLILFRPVVENYVDGKTFLAEDPKVLWANGDYRKVPWLTGYLPNEGIALLSAIFMNATLLQEFLANQEEFVPLLVGVPQITKSELSERFFGGAPIIPENAIVLTRVATEAAFTYPMMLGIQQHLESILQSEAPVSLYYFNFKGRYSCTVTAPILSNPYNSGACHSEDLMYLFRQPDRYPDFPSNSPEAAMSRLLVNEFVNFAYKGRLTLPRKCKNPGNKQPQQIGLVEFANSDSSTGVSAVYHDAKEEKVAALWEILHWWNKFHYGSRFK